MTYIQLLKHIESLSPERQQDTVTVAVHFTDDTEWYPVTKSAIANDDEDDVLDPGHLYLVIE